MCVVTRTTVRPRVLTLKLLCDLRLDREDVRGAVDELLLPPPRSKAGDKDKDKGKAKVPAPARDARCAAASVPAACVQAAQRHTLIAV